MAREEEGRGGNRKDRRKRRGRTNDVRTPATWVTRTYGLFRGEEK